jgi:putative nucleotidyltransferase with HDIG domain/PAS domain S-box-containing protein
MSESSKILQSELRAAQQSIAALREQLAELQKQQHAATQPSEDEALKKMEQAHQEWMSALDAINDPVFVHDREFCILRANRAYQQRVGIPFKEFIGRPYFEFFPKSDGPMPSCLLVPQPTDERLDEEIEIESRIYRSRAFPVSDEQGEFIFSVHTLEDVTDRKKMDDSLRESRELLLAFIARSPIYAFIKNVTPSESRVLAASDNFVDMTGIPGQEMIGKTMQELFPADFAEKITADDWNSVSGNKVLHLDEKLNGRSYMTLKFPIPFGKLNCLAGYTIDITEQKQAEQRLLDSDARYRSLFANMLNAYAYCHMLYEDGRPIDYVHLEVNAAFEKHTGLKDVVGKPISEVIPSLHELDPQFLDRYTRVVASGQPEHFESFASALGKWFSISVYRAEAEHFIVIFDDITERKQHEITLQRANRALRTISAGNQTLIHSSDEATLLRDMCEVAVKFGGYRMAWIGYARHDAEKSIEQMAQAGFDEGCPNLQPLTWNDTKRASCPAADAIIQNKARVVQDINNDASSDAWQAHASSLGYASCIALPLLDGEDAFGVLVLFDEKVDVFDAEEVELLEEMAGDLAFGILTLRLKLAHSDHEQHLQGNMMKTVEAIASIVEMRDPYTSGHQRRVAELAGAIAQKMGMTTEEKLAIHLAGIVHDLGKIKIPAEILSKPGRLNDIEYDLIKMHAQAGFEILKEIEFTWPIAEMVYQHHERMDGSGYPRGIKGDDLLPGARILAVADVMEAMSSHRPYRPGLGSDAALAELARGRGTLFDSQVVDACTVLIREDGYELPQ